MRCETREINASAFYFLKDGKLNFFLHFWNSVESWCKVKRKSSLQFCVYTIESIVILN